MKRVHLYAFLLIVTVIFSCKKKEPQDRSLSCSQLDYYAYLDRYKTDSLCVNDTCVNFQAIWKELFIENNNLTEDYFNDHIELIQSRIESWSSGESYRICYKIKVDWAVAYACDSFIIKIDKDNTDHPNIYFPRDKYLPAEDIKKAIDEHVFSSGIDKLTNIEILKFSSFENTLNFLIDKAEINTLCSSRIFINDITGNFILEAWAQYDNEYNKCIHAQVDLITGDAVIVESPCIYLNK